VAGNARPERASSKPCNNKEEKDKKEKEKEEEDSTPWKYQPGVHVFGKIKYIVCVYFSENQIEFIIIDFLAK
jgi:hypothetical protein